MPHATLTSKNQITLPAEVRDDLDLKPGDIIRFRRDDKAGILVEKVPPLSSFSGVLKSEVSLSDDELRKAIEEARAAMAMGDDWP